ncbi:MAG: polysaccharide deacetylase family protein [Eubacterium coprostanoligenes]|uniref:polysaccharide deacetylase family protein n=1 Tax=Eubacterium coprostanoligenes TaxID=290054 RepID=UPI002354BA04|nr:polysaccharide deacetylase family protein [Eubacterium coprostanoligenes]MCI7265135.1 polysaccharide deacetylase family protein [Eubacterium coprostanoligenes]
MKFQRILLPVLCVCMLFGCSKGNTNSNENITASKKAETTTKAVETTAPTAKAVAGLDSLSTEKVVWGPGNIVEHKQPNDPLLLQKCFSNMDAQWLLNDEKKICLTFDEGYENGYTPQILDTLKEKGVKAIFFVTYDFASQNPELVKRMIDEGHIVGNHSYRHYTMDEVSDDVAKEEVSYLHKYVKDKFGYTMSYFRFPKGEFSERSLQIVKDLGYKSVFWSFAYADWDPDNQTEENQAFTHICESTHPGAIFLLHAVSKTNADILGKVIDDVKKQGYTFSTDIC